MFLRIWQTPKFTVSKFGNPGNILLRFGDFFWNCVSIERQMFPVHILPTKVNSLSNFYWGFIFHLMAIFTKKPKQLFSLLELLCQLKLGNNQVTLGCDCWQRVGSLYPQTKWFPPPNIGFLVPEFNSVPEKNDTLLDVMDLRVHFGQWKLRLPAHPLGSFYAALNLLWIEVKQ